jgi:restriction endonuclease Mrr
VIAAGERTKRGVFRITARGRELLHDSPVRMSIQTLSQFPEFVTFHKGAGNGVGYEDEELKSVKAETPEE